LNEYCKAMLSYMQLSVTTTLLSIAVDRIILTLGKGVFYCTLCWSPETNVLV